jgi:hypothetical protein
LYISHPLQQNKIVIPFKDEGMGWSLGDSIQIPTIGDITEGAKAIANQLGTGAGEFVNSASHAAQDAIASAIKAYGAYLNIFGDVLKGKNADEILADIGKLGQAVGDVIVKTNLTAIIIKVYKENSLTAHTFHELDRISGGMLTSYANVSTLPARAMRGDAISKQELVRDALLGLQVVAVIFGGPAAAYAIAGSMVGHEACKNVGANKEACEAAVTIVAAAYGGNMTILDAGTVYLDQRIQQAASREITRACENGHWLGDNECKVMAEITAAYLLMPPDTDWPKFLAEYGVRLGLSLVMQQWFPKNSPEQRAIQYVNQTIPVPFEEYVYGDQPKKGGAFFLLAAATGAMLILGGS